MGNKTNLELRRDAAQSTLDAFGGKPFSFADGHDCGKMLAHHLKQLGVKIPLSKVGHYKTVVSARNSLKKQFGVDSLPALCDKMFERIPPASVIVGDIIEVECDHPLGALSVSLGGDLIIVYHEDAVGAIVGRFSIAVAAWRALPL